MKRSGPIYSLLAFVLLLSVPHSVEASRFDFDGGTNEGIIIFDGNFDVSTMQNGCSFLKECKTGFGLDASVRVLLRESNFTFLDIQQLFLVISPMGVDTLPGDCAAYLGSSACGTIGSIFPNKGLDADNVRYTQDNLPDDYPTNFARPIALLRVLPGDAPSLVVTGDTDFGLTLAAQQFLNAHPGLQWEVGFWAQYEGLRQESFSLIIERQTAVPEPGSLVLIGTGITALAARVRRRR